MKLLAGIEGVGSRRRRRTGRSATRSRWLPGGRPSAEVPIYVRPVASIRCAFVRRSVFTRAFIGIALLHERAVRVGAYRVVARPGRSDYVGSSPGGRSVRIGQAALRTTAIVTLPTVSRARPVRP
jgi:hypothetical protein